MLVTAVAWSSWLWRDDGDGGDVGEEMITMGRKFNRISFFETPKVLLLAWDKVFKIKVALKNKQYKPEDIQELLHELFNDVQNIHEELAEYINTLGWNHPAFCNNGDDDDEDCTIAITSDFLITDSLIMRDEHLDTIPEKESNKFNKSSVEDLVPNLSEFEDECECDVPGCDDSQMTNFSMFSNPLFDDEESSHEEDIHEMSFKTYSNPLFDLDEEIISGEFNPIHNEDLDSTLKNDRFDTDSYLLESSLNHDTLMISSLKIDSLLAEFVGELIFLELIPPRVDEANCDPDDSFMEEIDLFLTPDDPMPPSIEDDDDDFERDIIILEELIKNYSLSLTEKESFRFDIPSFSRPPGKPPDGNTVILNIKMMGYYSEQKVPIPGLMITLVSNQEKSPDLLSYRSLKNFQLSAKCPMMIHGKNIPILDVPLFHFYPP
nr:hypothetical protein [Tanacetum cinerariifolium]